MRAKRFVFVTKELLKWIRQYHPKLSDNGWIFPERMASTGPAYSSFKTLCEKAG